MEQGVEVQSILKSLEPEDAVSEARPDDSIFTQLLERIVQGYSLSIESGAEESDSLEILLDGVSDSVLIVSPSGSILNANQSFYRTFGYERETLIGSEVFALLPPSHQDIFRQKFADFGRREGQRHSASSDDILAFRGVRRDGTILTLDCLLSGVQCRGKPAVLMLIRDLSFDHALFEQLKETKDHYVALSETITEAIFRLDEDFTIIFANSGVKNTFGFERGEVVGKPFGILFPPEVFSQHEAEFKKYFFVDDADRLALGLKRTLEVLGATKNRGVAPMEMSFGNSKDYKGRTLTCVIRDITQRKTLERKLRHLAYHDKLTGLGNRDLFNEDIKSLLGRARDDPGWRGAVLFLDLDGFKRVNDTLGHSAGDELLIETGRRLRVCLRDRDSAYRFGGDEFVVVLGGIKETQDASLVAERILSTVGIPYILRSKGKNAGSKVNVGVSIGVAVIPEYGSSLEEATRNADIAMYCSKEAGKNRYTLYDPIITAKATEHWKTEQELAAAMTSGGLSLAYQPIVGPDGRVRGMEALLRWRRTDGRMVPPSEFIPLAEANGTVIALGEWALRKACYDTRKLHARGYSDVFVSVNLSGRHFDQANLVPTLADIVRRSGLPPGSLCIEVTETAVMKNTQDAIERIKEIKRLLPGIRFMIDDFGTGYSSLAYLSRLPVDALKIDISFVTQLAEPQNQKIVNAILNLARNLQLDTIAEGIETREEWQYFARRKCGAMQGYYILRPSTLGKVAALIERQARGKSTLQPTPSG
ncbi:MAG: EAL domain-containing protein [Treponema sp.]|nr:EAL domain-containing protein [Treponema sp.]